MVGVTLPSHDQLAINTGIGARMRLTVFLLVTLLSPAALAAQLRPDEARQFVPQCDSLHRPVMDSSQMIVALDAGRKWKDVEYTEAQRGTIRFYADAIRQHFRAPESLGDLPIIGEAKDSITGRISGSASLRGSLVVVMKESGGVRDLLWASVPLSISLANAVQRAAEVARAAGDFDGVPRLSDSKGDDTVAVELDAFVDSARARLPLMRVAMVSYATDSGAMARSLNTVQFPPSALRAGVGTEAEVQFAVGTDGRAVPSTIQVTRTDWRDFVAPLRDGIQAATFIPARSGGCAVPTIVRQSFDFKMNR
jgi:hypothetical protein